MNKMNVGDPFVLKQLPLRVSKAAARRVGWGHAGSDFLQNQAIAKLKLVNHPDTVRARWIS